MKKDLRFKYFKAIWTEFKSDLFYANDLMFLRYLMLSTWWQIIWIQGPYFPHCDCKDLLQADVSAARLFLKESKVNNCDIDNFARILVTPVLFSLWPCVMYCFHYFPMWLWCLLCIGTDCASGFSPGVHTKHVSELRVFLLVCGLRRIKDPLYLVEDFSGKSKNPSLDMTCRYIYTHAKTLRL